MKAEPQEMQEMQEQFQPVPNSVASGFRVGIEKGRDLLSRV